MILFCEIWNYIFSSIYQDQWQFPRKNLSIIDLDWRIFIKKTLGSLDLKKMGIEQIADQPKELSILM